MNVGFPVLTNSKVSPKVQIQKSIGLLTKKSEMVSLCGVLTKATLMLKPLTNI